MGKDVVGLREGEIRVLDCLKRFKGYGSVKDSAKALKTTEAAVMSTAGLLSERGLVRLRERRRRFMKLNAEGALYAERGLPERRLVEALMALGGRAERSEVGARSSLSEDAMNLALGWARRKGWISLERVSGGLMLSCLERPLKGVDEELLEAVHREGSMDLEVIEKERGEVVKTLKNRGLVHVYEDVERFLELTEEGLAVVGRLGEVVQEVGALTSDVVKDGRWRGLRLRGYDVTAAPPKIYLGKRHPYLAFLDEVRRLLLDMGFEEAEGPYVEAEFWNFDVLFQAQDHPAREIHDSYLLKYPAVGVLELGELGELVGRTHEDGWTTGSIGWRYRWRADVARRLVLRTQTTAVSARYLAARKEPPLKMFCISRVFRPDVLDATHSMEFYQCEGIVMDEGANFRQLLGFLKAFANSLGLEKLRFKPAYFPFTEPSVEGFVYHPTLGWVECLPGGMFRPEVLLPLNIKHPTLAWGIGIDRIAMAVLEIEDIRELFTRRLSWLREFNKLTKVYTGFVQSPLV